MQMPKDIREMKCEEPVSNQTNDMKSPRLLSVGEVAESLGVSTAKVYQLIRKGELEAVNLGRLYRVTPSAIERMLERLSGSGQQGSVRASGCLFERRTGEYMPEIFDDSSKQPVPVQDIYNAYEVARLLGISKNKVWELSKRGNDPLPLRRMEGQKKGSIAFRVELLDWAMRNFSKIGVG